MVFLSLEATFQVQKKHYKELVKRDVGFENNFKYFGQQPTYWEIGRLIVEFKRKEERRAEYGKSLLECSARDLTTQFGRGFGYSNLNLIRQFYLTYHYRSPILQSPIRESWRRFSINFLHKRLDGKFNFSKG